MPAVVIDQEELISKKAAAAALRVSIPIVDRLIRENKLSQYKPGGNRPYLFRSEVEAVIRDSISGPKANATAGA